MPIRTQRGRAAVYRSLWGWPLRSPRHLAALAVVLAAIGVGISLALPHGLGSRAVAPPSATSQPNLFDPRSRAAQPDHQAGRAPAPQAPAEALAVADAWARAFLHAPKGITSEQWVEQLRPYTTEETLAQLRTVNPANVPDVQLVGPPRTISTGAGTAEVDVPTTETVVRLLLVSTPGGWRVAGFDQVG